MRYIYQVLGAISLPLITGTSYGLDLAVDAVHADFFWQQGYTGSRAEVGVIDLFMAQSSHTAIDGNFRGSQKFVNGQSWVDNHATSVAGAAVSQDAARRGVAYDAGWWTAQTTNRGSISNPRTQTISAETFARGLGNLGGNPAEILTLSIGFDGNDLATDQWSLGLDHLVATWGTTIVVAAGNDGPAGGTLSGPPVAAFNILSVGATGGTGAAISEDYTQIAPYSSRGLTDDGRSKPDIVAPGSLLELPTLNNTWSVASGTSFATPLVAGGAALLVDMGLDRGMNTDALVVKSVLMNSADKLPGWSHAPTSPLDPAFGAGQMNLESAFRQYDAGEHEPGAVETIGWDYGAVANGSENSYAIGNSLPAGAQLTATLVWNRDVSSSTSDIETTIYAAAALANLDLFLYDRNQLFTPVAGSVSVVDNVEHLFLTIPMAGQYALVVRPIGTLTNPLPYSLAWNIEVPDVGLDGDYNNDGVVDTADYVVAQKGLPVGEYETWRAHFGESNSGAGAMSTFHVGIPEPSGMMMLLPAMLTTFAAASHFRLPRRIG